MGQKWIWDFEQWKGSLISAWVCIVTGWRTSSFWWWSKIKKITSFFKGTDDIETADRVGSEFLPRSWSFSRWWWTISSSTKTSSTTISIITWCSTSKSTTITESAMGCFSKLQNIFFGMFYIMTCSIRTKLKICSNPWICGKMWKIYILWQMWKNITMNHLVDMANYPDFENSRY